MSKPCSITKAFLLRLYQAQRDLYLSARDLFFRHDRLSGDQVERIKKRIETSSKKLENVKAAQKDNWAEEADRIIGTIERDQALISTLLARRVFIRHRCVLSLKFYMKTLRRGVGLF